MSKLMMILIAGLYRSGTGDDPEKMVEAECILKKRDVILRIGGASAGADLMVEVTQRNALQIYAKLEQIPPG